MTASLPQGFQAAGVSCGIKQSADTLDLALFASDVPCSAAGVFTTNRVVGAPVVVSRERVPSHQVRGVVINSGNANACTAARGLQDARRMTAHVAQRLGCASESILVCSTGVIGRFLPMDKIDRGIDQIVPQLSPAPEQFAAAARAMMTTDTVPKQAVRRALCAEREVIVAGAAKGAAMIAPNMATMLAVVMTDAKLAPHEASQMLKRAVDHSFNCISVDGHMSTSDTVLLLANGASGAEPANDVQREELQASIDAVCGELAQAIIRDAEGAEHFVTIRVSGAGSRADAYRLAKAVAESPLVKTAVAGNDPNWGRIVSAAGYAGVEFREEQVTLELNGFLLYESGRPVDFDEHAVSQSMQGGEVTIDLKFRIGAGQSTFWTSDLTAEYVRLNADYTT